jgi:hypothetical protein
MASYWIGGLVDWWIDGATRQAFPHLSIHPKIQ